MSILKKLSEKGYSSADFAHDSHSIMGVIRPVFLQGESLISAASLVFYSDKKVLLKKHSIDPLKLDLYGGKVEEKDNSPYHTALREFVEEAGVNVLDKNFLINDAITVDTVYQYANKCLVLCIQLDTNQFTQLCAESKDSYVYDYSGDDSTDLDANLRFPERTDGIFAPVGPIGRTAIPVERDPLLDLQHKVALMNNNDTGTYDSPINKNMREQLELYLKDGGFTPNGTFKHVISYLKGRTTSPPPAAVVDWFINYGFAVALRAKKITAVNYATVVLYHGGVISKAINNLLQSDSTVTDKEKKLSALRKFMKSKIAGEARLSKLCCFVLIDPLDLKKNIANRVKLGNISQPCEYDKIDYEKYINLADMFQIDVFTSIEDAVVKSQYGYKYIFAPSGTGKSEFIKYHNDHDLLMDGDKLVKWPETHHFWKSMSQHAQFQMGIDHLITLKEYMKNNPSVSIMFNPNKESLSALLDRGIYDRKPNAREPLNQQRNKDLGEETLTWAQMALEDESIGRIAFHDLLKKEEVKDNVNNNNIK